MTTNKDMARPPIAIIGAGFSGLVLGQCLRRNNIPATIYERVKANPTRNNYGITLYNQTYRPLLETLDIPEDEFKRRVAVHHPEETRAVSDDHKLRINRAALTNLLQEGLDIRYEHKISNLTSHNTTRSASFETVSQTQTQEYNTLIAADGVHSATRSLLSLPASSTSLKVLPYIVFNGKRRSSYSNIPTGLLDSFTNPDGITHTQANATLTIKPDFWNPDTQTLGISYTLSRPAGPESEKDQSILSRNIPDAETLAQHFVDEVAPLGPLPSPFGQVFNTQTMHEDRLLHWLMRSSLLEDQAIENSAAEFGVVLLGDAAHAQPIPGNGANVAIADALELAKHVESSSGEVDVAAFLKAKSRVWAEGRSEAEAALEEVHAGDIVGKARI